MTPVEIDNFVKCCSSLKVGDEVECYYPNGTTKTIVRAKVVAKAPYNYRHRRILYGIDKERTKSIGLVLLGIESGVYDPDSCFVPSGGLMTWSRSLISANCPCVKFKTLDGDIRVVRIFRS